MLFFTLVLKIKCITKNNFLKLLKNKLEYAKFCDKRKKITHQNISIIYRSSSKITSFIYCNTHLFPNAIYINSKFPFFDTFKTPFNLSGSIVV